jgi:ribose transport system ATP-binding protein
MTRSTSTGSQNGPTVLHVDEVSKRFGGNHALDRVNLALREGEIHALLGENGAGKSTLIKILAGATVRDSGEIEVTGELIPRQHSPARATEAGLAFVHQDLGLIDTLSVAENVALELGYRRRRSGLISFRATERQVAKWLESYGAAVSPRAMVSELSQDEKVMVAVTRALTQGARVIVLDEVSASLPAPEMTRLAERLRAAQKQGVGYIYVTHRIEEVFELADRVTVLRDGRNVATASVRDTTHDQVVRWIVGESLEKAGADGPPRSDHRSKPPRLRVESLTSAKLSNPVDFEVAAGEVVGICGLIGSGTREIARLLGGASRPSSGAAFLDDAALPLGHAGRLADAGCAYVPGDREREGAIAELSIRENLFAACRRGHAGDRELGDSFLRLPRKERKRAAALAEQFDVRPRDDVDRPLSALSGGNQQKVILGRALRSGPRLLVLDDPTAGVDVGSRVELHRLLRNAAEHGCAVVLASTDFEEIASQADRVLVMVDGRVDAELPRTELTEARLAAASYGISATNPQPAEVQS